MALSSNGSPRSAPRRKRKFTYPERYAVIMTHRFRCGLCAQPLRLLEATIDHFLPEWLKYDEVALQRIKNEWGLPPDFQIDSFANWVPAHPLCNQRKGPTLLDPIPSNLILVKRLLAKAESARKAAQSVSMGEEKDRLFAPLFVALERRLITVHDVVELVDKISNPGAGSAVPEDVIVLDNGYWVPQEDIVREGICSCDRNACVGFEEKVYCYFTLDLSSWVVNTGLYRRCYDEVVVCPRCARKHRRGHIGRLGVCAQPFTNQTERLD